MRSPRVVVATACLALASCAAEATGVSLAADAGPDRAATVDAPLSLQGSATGDAGGFEWRVSAGPGEAALEGADTPTPTFVARAEGTYVLSLVVRSGENESAPDYVAIRAGCDGDGDGVRAGGTCGGADCDDADAAVHPGAVERCGNGVDEDCAGGDLACGCADADQDGHPDLACGGDDCDDGQAGVHPGAVELCNGVDDDCSGADEGDCRPDQVCLGASGCGCGPERADCGGVCADLSSDPSHCGACGAACAATNLATTVCEATACGCAAGFVDLDGDLAANGCECTVLQEVCGDGIDQDCDGADLPADVDGDGALAIACGGDDCDDGDAAIGPGAVEVCDDAIDQDCDGTALVSDGDADGAVALACGGDDCDDADAAIRPGAAELCGDGVDQDCDGGDLAADGDGDGAIAAACGGDDCDDGDAAVRPGAAEVCGDGIDQDCSGGDLASDGDGDGAPGLACGGGDCDDADAAVFPGALELCDGLDQDCDGDADEDVPAAPCGPAAGAFALSGGGFVRDFLLLGPVAAQPGTCFEQATQLPGGDAAADPAPGDPALGAAWVHHADPDDTVDLDALSGSSDPDRLAWLFARLVVPASGHYEVRLEGSDAVEARLDGAALSLGAAPEACDDAAVHGAPVWLAAGTHRLLVRTSTNGGNWTVKLKLTRARRGADTGNDVNADDVRVDVGVGTDAGACTAGALTCAAGVPSCTGAIGPAAAEDCGAAGDEDCDGATDERDEDGDGIDSDACGGGDCDDRDRFVGPSQPELCDALGRDEDCSGARNDLAARPCGRAPEIRCDPVTGYFFDWLLLGPIDAPGLGGAGGCQDERDLVAAMGGPAEATLDPSDGDVAGPLGWRFRNFTAEGNGLVNLATHLAADGADVERVTVYAFARIWSPADRAARLSGSSADGVQVWLEGVEVLRYDGAARAYTPDSDQIDVQLRAGANRLLIKVTNQSGGFGFGYRFLNPATGTPYTDLYSDLGRGRSTNGCQAGTRTCGAGGWAACAGAVNAQPETCNGFDDDCDGFRLPGEDDGDGDGARPCGGDCDDGRADVGPSAAEVCDGRDNDCDGVTDPGRDDGQPDQGLCWGVAGAECLSDGGWVCPGGVGGRCRINVGDCNADADCTGPYGAGWSCAQNLWGDDYCVRCGAE